MTRPVRKLAGYVPISVELFGDLRFQRAARTPEEEARLDRARAEEEAHRAARIARHDRLLDVVVGPRRDLIEMHGPEPLGFGYSCGGCEFGGYDAEPPDWPCSTWVVAAEGEW